MAEAQVHIYVYNLLLDLIVVETKYQIQLNGQTVSSCNVSLMYDYTCCFQKTEKSIFKKI